MKNPAANIITCLRIACALGLIFCPLFSTWFYILYLVGGVSDVLDGFVARHFGKETKLGAGLDTIADVAFFIVVLIKLFVFVPIPLWITVWIGCIALIKCVNAVTGFIMYGRFISEHTAANKICGVLLFVFPLCICALPQTAARLFAALICAVTSFAAVQEWDHIRTGKEIR